jgi:CRP/FNR family transcriptional regulator
MGTRHACADCAIRNSALCRVLSAEQLARLNRVSCRRHYEPGRLIAASDQPQDWFGNVVSGVVKLTKTLSDGRQQIVGLLFPSDFLGRPFKVRSAYAAEAATHVELCCFSRQHFEQMMHGEPEMQQLLLEQTLEEVDAAREWMFVLGRKSAGEKVATLIRLIVERMRLAPCEACGEPQPLHFDLPLSRTEMADYLGLRIETVSRQLKRLRTAGVIEATAGRAITVRDVGALERMVETDGG